MLKKLGIMISRIKQVDKKFLVDCASDSDAHKIFEDSAMKTLKSLGCTATPSHKLRAQCSIIAIKVDSFIYRETEDEIKKMIEDNNKWAKVDKVTKFPKPSTMKITFTSVDMSAKACAHGLLMSHLTIPSYNIKQEIFIEIKTCFKCYSLGTHDTAACTQPNDYKICSRCSSNEHTFKNCQSNTLRCVNCKGAHSTLAFKCEIRKQKVKEQLLGNTYASTVNSASPAQHSYTQACRPNTSAKQHPHPNFAHPSAVPASTTPVNCDWKVNFCLSFASLKNLESPGCFESVLNELLTVNGYSSVKLGTVQPPLKHVPLQVYTGSMHMPASDHRTVTRPSPSAPTPHTSRPAQPHQASKSSDSYACHTLRDTVAEQAKAERHIATTVPPPTAAPVIDTASTAENGQANYPALPSVASLGNSSGASANFTICTTRNTQVTRENIRELFDKKKLKFKTSQSNMTAESCFEFIRINDLKTIAIETMPAKDLNTIQ